ncbi:MAG: acyloxyacyl hydrolase [Phycisphaerales bacterium]|nr:acyloxyacyl hydrolase [Phycisphaerales bacterium]
MSKSLKSAAFGARAATVIVAAAACAARGDEPELAGVDAMQLDVAAASFRWEPPAAATAEETPAEQPVPRPAFGTAGSKWWTVGIAGADNFQNAVDLNISGAYSYFLAKDIEWALEGAAWHFNQPGDNAFGGSASMVLRWHFVDTGDWTVYADAGIGLLLATDDVPPDGTSFDFLPRAGLGFTRLLNDDGLRLQVGVRWHHISNARITSDSDNPGRDSAMIYAGLIFPF